MVNKIKGVVGVRGKAPWTREQVRAAGHQQAIERKGVINMATYKIIRFSKKGTQRAIQRGLSLDEARRYCQREDTKGKNWFCGFTKE